MNLIRIINFLLLILDGLHRVNARLIYEYHHATLLRVRPLLELSFIEKIFPDYPCLFLQALPDSYIHSRILAELYQQLSPHIAILNTNLIHATSVCRGLIVVSTSMNLSVDFITQNKPFHKHMRVYIILIKFWNQYLFFQQHWAKELLDLDVLVITVFSSQKKVYRLKSYSSEFKMVGVRKQTNYFPSFHMLSKPSLMNYRGRQIVVATYKCNLFNTLRGLNKTSTEMHGSKINSFVGIEERIFLEIALRLNLTWKLSIPEKRKVYGTPFPNKSLGGGLMTDLYKGTADIGFCALWYDQVKVKSFDMSVFWSAVCPKFLFPKPKKFQTNWRNLFEPFNWKIWTLLLSCILLQTQFLMWVSKQSLRLKIVKTRYYLHPMNSLLEVIRILFMAGCMSTKKMPHLGPIRHLISWWFVFSLIPPSTPPATILISPPPNTHPRWGAHLKIRRYRNIPPKFHQTSVTFVFSLIVATIYSSSYYSHLTSPEYTPKIEGIRQLLEQKIRWGSSFPPPHSWIFHSSDSIHQEYGRFYEVEHSVEQRIARLAEGNYAAYCTNLNNLFFMDVDEIPPKLLKDLRSFRTCLAQLFVSFGLRLGTSYLEQVNKIILRLLQSGIIDYWLIRIILLHYHRNPFNRVYEYKPQSDKNIHEPLTLSSLEGAFYLYLVGNTLAGVIFLVELRHNRGRLSEKNQALLLAPKPRFPRMRRSQRILFVQPQNRRCIGNTCT
ncbi:hypothetical protein M8J77_025349 [Diaphorina citri]|nr:hypothetical protein M8J77_025349 [Diaphorina citri]